MACSTVMLTLYISSRTKICLGGCLKKTDLHFYFTVKTSVSTSDLFTVCLPKFESKNFVVLVFCITNLGSTNFPKV